LSLKPCERCEVELATRDTPMNSRINNDFEQIDHRTCVSICDAIGERLQQSIRPESELSPRLRKLIEELHLRDKIGVARVER
jgi:hypothetical protein